MRKQKTLNSYDTQIAIQTAISNKSGKCECIKNTKLEGMTITIGEILEYSEWINPDIKKSEVLLMLGNMPLVSISKSSFESYFKIVELYC